MSSPIAIPTRRDSDLWTTPPDLASLVSCSVKTQPISCPGRPLVHTDSGYGTGNNTSFVSLSDKAKDLSSNDRQEKIARGVPIPGREDLHLFRTDINEVITARFREIAPEMQRRLFKTSQKGISLFQSSKAKSRRQLTMSIRLMMVGCSADTASPTIVIFLSGEGASRLEAELEQPYLRQLYQPDDGIAPSFSVAVVSQAPRKRLCQDIQVMWDTTRSGDWDLLTYCGVQIALQTAEDKPVMSTLGGVIKVTYGPGDFKLVGMTAGHPLEELLNREPGDALPDDTKAKSTSDESAARGFAYPRAVGTVLYPRLDDEAPMENDERDYRSLIPACDWALFEINPAIKIRPNLLHQVGAASSHPRRPANLSMVSGRTMTTAPADSFPSVESIEVALLSGSSCFSGTMLGKLSHVPGGIVLSPEQGFVDAYLLTLDEGQAVQDGDSGSWVVNPISLEVYGHVVATDYTGDAYIIPLHKCFDEMREMLGVESVDLPRTADLLEAALRIPDAGKPRPMVVEDSLRERRGSEVLLFCEGWRLRGMRRTSVCDDGDSGYGSLGSALSTPFGVVTDEEQEKGLSW